MTVSIGNVWDSTTDVLTGRGGLLTPIAALAFFLPSAVQAAVTSYAGSSPVAALLGAVAALLGVVAAVWGSLAVIGIASDPDATRHTAGQAARRRLGAALLVSLVVGAAFLAATLPLFGVLWASGVDFRAAAGGADGAQPAIGPGVALVVILYGVALLIAGLWFGARLVLLSPVVLHERRGIGAIGRSMALTRGLTIKLIGATILLLVVWGVAALAARYVVFIPLRLILGTSNLATASWLGGLASAAVGAVFSTLVAVFTGRLYAAVAPASAPAPVLPA